MSDVRDFALVTETAGRGATREQLQMIRTRYHEAARHASGTRVLEVACGPGRGLAAIAARARSVVGGDFSLPLLQQASRHYGGRMPLVQLDAQHLPFAPGSFDLVVMYEAIYYLSEADRFVAECRRVLAPGGVVLLCSANREWPEFTTSAMAVRYYSGMELVTLLQRHGFAARLMAAFRAEPKGLLAGIVSTLRRSAVSLGVVPKTLVGREWLKRAFYGPLTTLGPEVDEASAQPAPLVAVDPAVPVATYKVLFAVGELQTGRPGESQVA